MHVAACFGRELASVWQMFVCSQSAVVCIGQIGQIFSQSLESFALPSNLNALHFGLVLDLSREGVLLPSNLQILSCGETCSRTLDGFTLPVDLLTSHFGRELNHGRRHSAWPDIARLEAGSSAHNPAMDHADS